MYKVSAPDDWRIRTALMLKEHLASDCINYGECIFHMSHPESDVWDTIIAETWRTDAVQVQTGENTCQHTVSPVYILTPDLYLTQRH